MQVINHQGQILAIIIPHSFKQEGIKFFTPDSFSQQVGYMNRPKGYEIAPHTHNPVPRTIEWTQEVLYIKTGLVRMDLYTNEQEYLESLLLHKGDVVLLAHGGHGFYMIEPSEIIEVKQGPYVSEKDKNRFLASTHITIKTD